MHLAKYREAAYEVEKRHQNRQVVGVGRQHRPAHDERCQGASHGGGGEPHSGARESRLHLQRSAVPSREQDLWIQSFQFRIWEILGFDAAVRSIITTPVKTQDLHQELDQEKDYEPRTLCMHQ